MPCPRCERHAGQRGAALVIALLILAVSTALVVAMIGNFERVYQRAGSIFVAEQSGAYLRGAEGLATLALLADYDQDKDSEHPRDTLAEFWAQPPHPYAIDDGWLTGQLEDLQGRFNLNRLALQNPAQEEGGPRFEAVQAQFIRLLQALGEPRVSEVEAIELTAAIGDWLDADGEVRPEGAEDDAYLGREPAYRVANRPMQSVSELLAVRGMTPELYAALQRWVTVWPLDGSGGLNINTAPVMVLRSLGADDSLQPLGEEDALALVRYACEKGFASVDDFLDQPAFADSRENMPKTRELLREQSDYFLLRAQVEVAGSNRRLYSVLQRKNRQVSVLNRTADAGFDPQELERVDPCER